MKRLASLAATLLIASIPAFAADPVKIDIYVEGKLKHQVELTGPNATSRFALHDAPETQLELRLIAPEPIIVEFRETRADQKTTSRIKLIEKGSFCNVSELKGGNFQRPYVLQRPE